MPPQVSVRVGSTVCDHLTYLKPALRRGTSACFLTCSFLLFPFFVLPSSAPATVVPYIDSAHYEWPKPGAAGAGAAGSAAVAGGAASAADGSSYAGRAEGQQAYTLPPAPQSPQQQMKQRRGPAALAQRFRGMNSSSPSAKQQQQSQQQQLQSHASPLPPAQRLQRGKKNQVVRIEMAVYDAFQKPSTNFDDGEVSPLPAENVSIADATALTIPRQSLARLPATPATHADEWERSYHARHSTSPALTSPETTVSELPATASPASPPEGLDDEGDEPSAVGEDAQVAEGPTD